MGFLGNSLCWGIRSLLPMLLVRQVPQLVDDFRAESTFPSSQFNNDTTRSQASIETIGLTEVSIRTEYVQLIFPSMSFKVKIFSQSLH